MSDATLLAVPVVNKMYTDEHRDRALLKYFASAVKDTISGATNGKLQSASDVQDAITSIQDLTIFADVVGETVFKKSFATMPVSTVKTDRSGPTSELPNSKKHLRDVNSGLSVAGGMAEGMECDERTLQAIVLILERVRKSLVQLITE